VSYTALVFVNGKRSRAHTIKEQSTSLIMGCNALQKSKRIADSVGSRRRELRWVEKCIDRNDLLQQRGHDAYSELVYIPTNDS